MPNLKALLSDKMILLLSLVGLLLALFNILLVTLQVDTTQTVAITRYNLINGQTFTRGNTRSIYVMALAPAVFFVINSLLSARIHQKQRLLSILICSFSIVVLLFSVVVSSAIINVNK